MPRTVTPRHTHVPGDLIEVDYDVAGDAAYPAGGYPFAGTDADVDLKGGLVHVDPGAWLNVAGSGAFVAVYNRATGKLQAFTAAAVPGGGVALVEVTANTNLSTYTSRVRVTGRGSVSVL